MKKIFLILALVLCLAGCVSKCARWQAENDKKALESCAMVHNVETCKMWQARGY